MENYIGMQVQFNSLLNQTNLLVWHCAPAYPGWQLQAYPLTWSVQHPLFKQGLLEHSSMSMRQKNQNNIQLLHLEWIPENYTGPTPPNPPPPSHPLRSKYVRKLKAGWLGSDRTLFTCLIDPLEPEFLGWSSQCGICGRDLFLHSCSLVYLFHSGPHRIPVNSHNGIDHHCNLERTFHCFYMDS